MNKVFVLAAAMLVMAGQALAQGPFEEGSHHQVIERDNPLSVVDGVVVTEAFSYLCNHCMTFEPYVQSWKARLPEGVEFRRIPVEFGRATWGLYARAYVAASVMGIEEDTHVPMMDAIWKQKRQMRSMDQLAEFYSAYGVEKDKFLATAKSFAVDMQMRREQSQVRESGVTGTPSMVVNGKYRVSSGGAINNFDTMLAVVDYLVAEELRAQSASAEHSPGDQ